VAGTISGEDATGAGQILTGKSGEANVEGLSVRYTGATTGAVGNIILTLGVAELFDRALFGITDSYEGYVSFKQDSLQDQVKRITNQVENMEALLQRKKEQMINRFVAMELTLSRLQNQSNWLAGQISGLSNYR
jgi:flagellar hook-associated protein 2